MSANEWLMLNFTLPKEPSRVRVSVWRKLKKVGSVNIGQSMWTLPPSEDNAAVFHELSKEILQNNGEAFILKAEFLSTGNAERIVSFFNADRDEEYKEFLGKCEDFHHELNKETQKQNFTFAEVEENEEEYQKLDVWLNKIAIRDFFGAPLKQPSLDALDGCKSALEAFSEKVYSQNS